jgi:hypothetical protein
LSKGGVTPMRRNATEMRHQRRIFASRGFLLQNQDVDQSARETARGAILLSDTLSATTFVCFINRLGRNPSG